MYGCIQSHNNIAPGTNTHRYIQSLINTHAHTYGMSTEAVGGTPRQRKYANTKVQCTDEQENRPRKA